MNVPFAPGAQSPTSGPAKELPPSHVGRPHPSHHVRNHLTPTADGGTVTITEILKDGHGSSDVLPERVKPRGETKEESESPPTGEGPRPEGDPDVAGANGPDLTTLGRGHSESVRPTGA